MNNSQQLLQLRAEAISCSTLNAYLLSISNLLVFLFNFDPYAPGALNHPEEYVYPLTEECHALFTEWKQEEFFVSKQKKLLKEELSKLEPMRMVDCSKLSDQHLLLFIISLKKSNGDSLSFSAVNMHRAAFKHLFKMYQCRQTPESQDSISICFKSLKKRSAKNAQNGTTASSSNTKLPLHFNVFFSLAGFFLRGLAIPNEEDRLANCFGHLFLLLGWNTMQRAGTISQIRLRHIDWRMDSMLIYIHQAKNDQEGEQSMHPKHIFANPVHPEICPVLALAIFLLLVDTNENSKVFEGTKQDERFRQLLSRAADSAVVADGLQMLGFNKEKLGVHSLRKGAATFCVSGSTASPSQASIDLRGGWSQGKIKDVYQHSLPEGDQYLGRILCGLPRHDVKFATLFPRFGRDANPLFIQDSVKSCYPSLYSSNFLLGKNILASLVYHSDFLENYLPPDHILFQCQLFTSKELFLRPLKELLQQDQFIDDSGITATGIPPDIFITKAVEDVPNKVDDLLQKRSISWKLIMMNDFYD